MTANPNHTAILERLTRFTIRLLQLAWLLNVLEYALDRSFDREDPPAQHRIQAKAVREVSKLCGLDCFPIILREREQCAHCEMFRMVHVQPEDICVDCWGRTLGLAFRFGKS